MIPDLLRILIFVTLISSTISGILYIFWGKYFKTQTNKNLVDFHLTLLEEDKKNKKWDNKLYFTLFWYDYGGFGPKAGDQQLTTASEYLSQ